MVLTAAHNVAGSVEPHAIYVRSVGGAQHRARIVVSGTPHGATDIALLELVDVDGAEPAVPIRYVSADRRYADRVENCWAVGFPGFKDRASAGPRQRVRETAQVGGIIRLASNLKTGSLELLVEDTPPTLVAVPGKGSPWQGMSGAVVFVRDGAAGDVALGVIVEHHLDEGASSLTVAPVGGLGIAAGERAPDIWRRLRVAGVATLPRLAADGGTAAQMRLGAVAVGRVCEWDPLHLGVHRAIVVDGATSHPNTLPTYARRSHDKQLDDLLNPPPSGNLLVMVTGSSSTGKSRAAYEALRRNLPDWNLFRPTDGEQLNDLVADDSAVQRCVVWLDDAQEYFDGPGGQPVAAALRRLLAAPPRAVVVIGTMWPGYWARFDLPPEDGEPDRFYQTRHLLVMAAEVAVPEDLADDPAALAELERLGRVDPRLGTALRTGRRDGRVIQVLAGGVDLVKRYEQSTNPYGKALLSAAMYARLLGYHAPIPPALLNEALAAYLTPRQRGEIGRHGGFAGALAYALRETKGVAALHGVRHSDGIGEPDGYVVHDYLDQYARRHLAGSVPALMWQALIRYADDASDLARIGDEAYRRGLFRYAAAAWVRGVQADGGFVLAGLAALLVELGMVADAVAVLRPAAQSGDVAAAIWLAELAARGEPVTDVDEILRPHLAYEPVAAALAGLLARRGDVAGLRDMAGRGVNAAALLLADVLLDGGRVDEAVDVLVSAADHPDALERLTKVLGDTLYVDRLRAELDSGDLAVATRLGEVLLRTNRTDEAIAALRQAAEAGYLPAAARLTAVLTGLGELDGAIALIRDGGWTPAATAELVAPLLIDDHLAELRALADGGAVHAVLRLASLLMLDGQLQEAIRTLRMAGAHPVVAERLMDLLVSTGEFDRLRTEADAGDTGALVRIAGLFSAAGRHPEAVAVLRHAAEAGDAAAQARLSAIVAEVCDKSSDDGLMPYRVGVMYAAGWVDGLRTQAAGGNVLAAAALADYLIAEDRLDEAYRFLRRLVADRTERSGSGHSPVTGVTGLGLSDRLRLAIDLGRSGEVDQAAAVCRSMHGDDDLAWWLRLVPQPYRLAVVARTGDPAEAGPSPLWTAHRLFHEGRLGEAVGVLRAAVAARTANPPAPVVDTPVGASDDAAVVELADIFIRNDHPAYAVSVLHASADARQYPVAGRLANCFTALGSPDNAVAVLLCAAEAGAAEARDHLARLVADQPPQPPLDGPAGRHAVLHRAGLLEHAGLVDAAVAALRPAVEAKVPAASLRLAELLDRVGRPEESIDVLRTESPDSDGIFRTALADLLARRGDMTEAIAVLRPMAAAGDVRAAIRMAAFHADGGDLESAIAVLRPAADLGDPAAAVQLCDVLVEAGRHDEAAAVLRTAAATGDAFVAGRAAWLRRQDGTAANAAADARLDTDAAGSDASIGGEAPWQETSRAESGDDAPGETPREEAPPSRIQKVLSAVAADLASLSAVPDLPADHDRTPDSAASSFSADQVTAEITALQRGPFGDDPFTMIRIARLMADTGRNEEALDLSRKATAQNPRIGLVPMANLLLELDRTDEAIVALHEACLQGARQAESRLAQALLDSGRIDELRAVAEDGNTAAAFLYTERLARTSDVAALKRALQTPLYADSVWFRTRLANRFGADGETNKAIAVLRPLEDDPYVATQLNDLLVSIGRFEPVIAALQRAGQPQDQAYRALQIADLYRQAGQHTEAVSILTLSLRHTADPYTSIQLADALIAIGRPDQAAVVLESAAEPYVAVAAAMLAELDRVDAAVTLLRPAASESLPATLQIADLLARQGDLTQARDLLRNPPPSNDGQLLIQCGLTLLRRGDIETGLRLLRPFLDSCAENLLVVVAELLHEAGRVDEAIALLRPAVATGNAVALGGTCDILRDLRRYDDALALLRPVAHRAADLLSRGRYATSECSRPHRQPRQLRCCECGGHARG